MRQAKVVVRLIHDQLLTQPLFLLAERQDPSSDRRYMLADIKVEAFHKGRVDLPATRCQHVVDTIERTEDHPVFHTDQAPPAHGLDDLGIEQLWQGHPTGLGSGAFAWAALGLHPPPI